ARNMRWLRRDGNKQLLSFKFSRTENVFMKTAAIELNPSNGAEVVAPLTARARVGAYLELTKPRITVLIMLTSAAGFALGSRGAVDYVLLTHALVGIGLLSSG